MLKKIWKGVSKIFSIVVISGIVYHLFHKVLKFLQKEDKIVMEKLDNISKEKLEKDINQNKASIKKHKNNIQKIKSKYSNPVQMMVFVILLPIFLGAMSNVSTCGNYIIWDKQEQRYRDYTTITNYTKSLEEINNNLRSEVTLYSNNFLIQSNLRVIDITWKEYYKEKAEDLTPNFFDNLKDKGFWAGMGALLYILLNK